MQQKIELILDSGFLKKILSALATL